MSVEAEAALVNVSIQENTTTAVIDYRIVELDAQGDVVEVLESGQISRGLLGVGPSAISTLYEQVLSEIQKSRDGWRNHYLHTKAFIDLIQGWWVMRLGAEGDGFYRFKHDVHAPSGFTHQFAAEDMDFNGRPQMTAMGAVIAGYLQSLGG